MNTPKTKQEHSHAIAHLCKDLMVYMRQNFDSQTVVTVREGFVEVLQGHIGITVTIAPDPLIVIPNILPPNNLRANGL